MRNTFSSFSQSFGDHRRISSWMLHIAKYGGHLLAMGIGWYYICHWQQLQNYFYDLLNLHSRSFHLGLLGSFFHVFMLLKRRLCTIFCSWSQVLKSMKLGGFERFWRFSMFPNHLRVMSRSNFPETTSKMLERLSRYCIQTVEEHPQILTE